MKYVPIVETTFFLLLYKHNQSQLNLFAIIFSSIIFCM